MTPLEHAIITAIRELGEAAYGIPLYRMVKAEHPITLGALYVTLERLEDKGLVVHWDEPGGPERGGRIKRSWRIRY